MRRQDFDNHAPRMEKVPPFKVLGTVGPYYPPSSPPPPPPPRAPEPYKITPAVTSSNRAHRRSSFVIIAETRPITPNSRSSSPSLASGRVSPFRGRGFKGPPPHAQSRPQTPDHQESKKLARSGRRAPVSQQNSPKRSLIPQPTRRRSISLSNDEDHSISLIYGRRTNPKNQPIASTRLVSNRRGSLKPPGLSPIQGTPTKPLAARKSSFNAKDLSKDRKVSPTKSRRNSLLPPKSVSSSRRTSREISPKKETPTSPSRIPLKRGSSTKKGGTVQTQLNRRSSITKSLKSGDSQTKRFINDNSTKKIDHEKKADVVKEDGSRQDSQKEQTEPTQDNLKSVFDKESKRDVDEGLGLVDLLKQSSGATGTSSMVNTTTTTAVQPLHIDAATILKDMDVPGRSTKDGSQAKQEDGLQSGSTKSNIAQERTSGQASSQSGQNGQETSQRGNNGNATNGNINGPINEDLGKINNGTKNGSINSMVNAGNGEHSRTANSSQSVKSFNKAGGSSNIENASGNQVNNSNKGQSVINEGHASAKSNDKKVLERNGDTSDDGDMKNLNQLQTNASGKTSTLDQSITIQNENSKNNNNSVQATIHSGYNKSDGKSNDSSQTGKLKNVSDDKQTNNSTGGRIKNATSAVSVSKVNGGTKIGDHGSNISVKSSSEISTGSMSSVRSTDTGVSVNTVRGVSSAREKKGMHTVKKPQEIETLSWNVMHLEQNGEPAVVASESQDNQDHQTELSRWRKHLARYSACCSNMRCLACRRGPKAQAWLGRSAPAAAATATAVNTASNAETEKATGCLTKLKTAYKCPQWPRSKCFARGSRVAPAESNVCCPPERRCGALWRRLFARCKSSRPDVERTRSIRAKQSLTSVAAPPVSEEPKVKIPEVLVEHNSLMRGAIPCLPVTLAWFCLVWNVLLPGSGTLWSGLFNLYVGQPRFSAVAGPKARFGAFIVNLVVGAGQLFTVLFCLVGWGWSIWWGVTMVRLARKYKRFRDSEAASADPEARAGEPAALPPGVPSQALRGMERAR
ncbi:protein stum [Cephus cinctus]|uniref:Protein stum n=1 Tax=Cephus cinctus TaxID=211228 RepID=A0AAJ7FC94_CEPCN|nr:protein stum [Cephus cinctus]